MTVMGSKNWPCLQSAVETVHYEPFEVPADTEAPE
jgi:hypothetical protein